MYKYKKRFLAIVLSSFYAFSFLFAQHSYGFDCKQEQKNLTDLLDQQRNSTLSDTELDKLEKKITIQQRFVDTVCPKPSYTGTAARIAAVPVVNNAIASSIKNLLDIMKHSIFVGQNIQEQRPMTRNIVVSILVGLWILADGFILLAP